MWSTDTKLMRQQCWLVTCTVSSSRKAVVGVINTADIFNVGDSCCCIDRLLERGCAWQAVQWFWKVVHSLQPEQQKQLLFFVTGSDRVPIKGLASLTPTFTISRAGPHSDRLPTAHTCFNHLLLPEYKVSSCSAVAHSQVHTPGTVQKPGMRLSALAPVTHWCSRSVLATWRTVVLLMCPSVNCSCQRLH